MSSSASLNPGIRALRCSLSGQVFSFKATRPLGLCSCCTPARPLLIDYAAERLAEFASLPRSAPWSHSGSAMERYAFALPVLANSGDYFQGVGLTTSEKHPALSAELDCEIFIKCEGQNPSGSFKDRGLSVAILLAQTLGAQRFCLPTQGNAGVAAALFSARLGLPPCAVWMPRSHERSYYDQCARHFGAEVTLHGDNIAEAGKAMRLAYADALARGEIVDLSTFFEPGRLEGKKTLGLEIAETFAERLPDVVVYPTGGGTGLVGIWKAFEELQAAGVLAVDAPLPKLVAVQAEGCAPVVRAFEVGAQQVSPVTSQGTCADGLNVPGAIMGHEMLRVLRDSKGFAVAVSETEIASDFSKLGHLGVPAGYESAATLSALRRLLTAKEIAPGSRVLLLLTSGPSAALHRG